MVSFPESKTFQTLSVVPVRSCYAQGLQNSAPNGSFSRIYARYVYRSVYTGFPLSQYVSEQFWGNAS